MHNTKKSIKIYSPVIKPNKYAFNTEIENVLMLHTVKSIKSSAFFNCSALKNIEISKNVTEIGSYAFTNCSSLENVSVPESVKNFCEGVFKGCTKLKSVTLPKGTKKLPCELFENCRELESITLPDGLEAIGKECFSGCINLKEIIFPESIKTIETKAFKRCSSLKSIVFPKNLKHIGGKAFDGCTSLTNVVFEGSPEYVGKASFPEFSYTLPTVNGTMFSTSFLPKSDYSLCPTIKVQKAIKSFYLGFENTLNYKQRCENKTCYNHILSLEKYNAKLFIGENYYSYNKNDAIIENSSFDFQKYDNQFEKAEESEKPVISAFRLTYPIDLKEENEIIYKTNLANATEYAALFATEKNEEDVLKYISDNFELTTEYCTLLYEKASKNGFYNIMQILSQNKNKNGFNEINLLYEDIFG